MSFKAYLNMEINEEVPLSESERGSASNSLGITPTAKVEQQISFSTKAEGSTLSAAAAAALERAKDLLGQVGPAPVAFGN